jgi:GNAT superfamily N-acetyltransferase
MRENGITIAPAGGINEFASVVAEPDYQRRRLARPLLERLCARAKARHRPLAKIAKEAGYRSSHAVPLEITRNADG